LDFSDEHGKAQRAAIVRVGRGGRFGLIIGAAGMGKSSAIKPLAAAWREQGRDVWGASLAWRQADDLALARTNWSEGIDKWNVKAFSVMMDAIEAGDIKLSRRSVLVIDEFGMLGTRSGLRLLRAQEKHGFSVVALGDEKQVQSIEAGPLVDLARRALGRKNVPEILTTKRQKTERERNDQHGSGEQQGRAWIPDIRLTAGVGRERTGSFRAKVEGSRPSSSTRTTLGTTS
jgi:ATP-dependent exoDNAse (exonuclease V) alpha subunit